MVDHHGQVREIIIGMLSEQELERKIENLEKEDAFGSRVDPQRHLISSCEHLISD